VPKVITVDGTKIRVTQGLVYAWIMFAFIPSPKQKGTGVRAA